MVQDSFLTFKQKSNYENYHETIKSPIKGVWTLRNETTRSSFPHMRSTANRIQALIAHAAQSGTRLRAVGSKWSFSEIPLPENGWVLQTDLLNYRFKIHPNALEPGSIIDPQTLVFVQAGMSIGEINRYIESTTKRRALRTSGASNGQTIAGAMATGTHGSAVGVGAIQSQIAGVQLLTQDKNFWIERSGDPHMSEKFARALGATLVRDDRVFDAALVNLGALGIVHAMLLKTTGRYRLKSYRKHMPLTDVMRAMNTLDFNGVPLPEPFKNPYFFQVVVNPQGDSDIAYVTVRYKTHCPHNYKPDFNVKEGYDISNDLPGLFAQIAKTAPVLTPVIVRALVNQQLKEKEWDEFTPGEVYDHTSGKKDVLGASISVPIRNVSDVLDLSRGVYNDMGGAPMILAFRYAQHSPGLLSFTRFDPSCIMDIDGVDTPKSRRYLKSLLRKFDQVGLPYTQHWGKIHDLTKTRVRRSYGGHLDIWTQIRNDLLPTEVERRVFANDLTDKIGLT